LLNLARTCTDHPSTSSTWTSYNLSFSEADEPARSKLLRMHLIIQR